MYKNTSRSGVIIWNRGHLQGIVVCADTRLGPVFQALNREGRTIDYCETYGTAIQMVMLFGHRAGKKVYSVVDSHMVNC